MSSFAWFVVIICGFLRESSREPHGGGFTEDFSGGYSPKGGKPDVGEVKELRRINIIVTALLTSTADLFAVTAARRRSRKDTNTTASSFTTGRDGEVAIHGASAVRE